MEVPNVELLEKVKIEINENDARRKQSLEHFREWIDKHPFLTNCRKDDSYLLQFLRTKKYSMDDVFKVYENHFLFRHENPDWFNMGDVEFDRIQVFMNTAVGYILTKRDKETGSYVAVFNSENFNLDKYTHKDLFHSVFTSLVCNLENEDNQILGYSCLLNFSNTPAKFFTSVPIGELCEALKILERCPGRYKKIVVYGLPSVAVAIFNIAKSCLSEKQKSRLFVVKGNDELHKIFDKSILTERFGGPEKQIDVVKFNNENMNKYLSAVRSNNNFSIDTAKAAGCGKITHAIGSFRKLEID